MKNIFRKVEDRLSTFSRDTEDIKEAQTELLQMEIIMSVIDTRLYTSAVLISELEDME